MVQHLHLMKFQALSLDHFNYHRLNDHNTHSHTISSWGTREMLNEVKKMKICYETIVSILDDDLLLEYDHIMVVLDVFAVCRVKR